MYSPLLIQLQHPPAWRGFVVRGGWLCRAMKLTYAECMKASELRELEIDNREAECLRSWELREEWLSDREEELLDFERQLDTEMELRARRTHLRPL